jgi:hypothetical protein
MTEQPLINNSVDSYSLEICTTLSKNINIGIAAMYFDGKDKRDWVMLKGWFINLASLM